MYILYYVGVVEGMTMTVIIINIDDSNSNNDNNMCSASNQHISIFYIRYTQSA